MSETGHIVWHCDDRLVYMRAFVIAIQDSCEPPG